MDQKGIEKAVLGIRYLLKYVNQPNMSYFSVIKECTQEIKLWSLLTFFSNNMDDLWKDVPDFLLEDLFLMRKVETVEGIIDYGRGYHSSSFLPFKDEFKRIRDLLSHMKFIYQDPMVYLEDEYHTSFDVAWLENFVLSTVSNSKNGFQKGMSDIVLFNLFPQRLDIPLNFQLFWNLGLIQFLRITLLKGNKETVAAFFKESQIPAERYTFDLLFQAIKLELQRYHLNLNVTLEEMVIDASRLFRIIEKKFGNSIKIEFVKDLTFPTVIGEESFQELSYHGKLQYLISRLKMQGPHSYNSIITHNLMDILREIDQDIYQKDHLFILRDAKEFLMKVYAYVLFSCVYVSKDYDYELKKQLQERFMMDMHFVHAKNIYSDYLKQIKRSYEEVCTYHGSREDRLRLLELVRQYTKLLDEVYNDEVDKRLFWNLRNAFVHDQIEFKENQFRFYITGKNIPLKHYHKKSGEWVSKTFQNNRVIWELVMNQDEFVHMMDYLYQSEGIQTQINISKQIRKKK